MRLIIFILINCLFSEYFIKGQILDKVGNPINNANISLLKSNNSSSSDIDGNFIIETDAIKNKIEISHIKYITKIISIDFNNNDDNFLKIYLDENTLDLEQYVVTGMRTQTFIKNTPVITRIISSDDIQKTAYSSVKEILEMSLPNVQNVISSHAGISNENVKIQGLDNKYILFLLDGKRVSGEFAGNLDFKMLDLSNIDRIEIVEGGMSSLYGSSAIGGVVNIITKKNKEPFKFDYTYLYDDPMINSHSFNSSINYKKIFYSLGFVQQSTDGYDLTSSPESATFDLKTLEEYRTRTLKHKLGYTPSNNFGIDFYYKSYENNIYMYQTQTLMILDNQDPNYPFYNYQTLRNWVPKFKDNSYGMNIKFYNKDYIFRIEYSFEKYVKSNYFFNYTEQNCDIVDCSNSNNVTPMQFDNGIDENENILLQYNRDYKNNFITLGIEIKNDKYSSYNVYKYGGDFNEDGMCGSGEGPWDPDDCWVESIFNSQDGTKKFNKKSFFVGNQFSINENNKLSASFRFVDSKNFKNNYVYSLAYMLKNFRTYDIRLNYSKGFRTPSIKELYYDWYGHSPPIIGNPDLVPTTNNYVSTSIEKKINNYNISFELFHNDVDDMIGINYTEDAQGNEVAQYNNYKSILFYGINSHLDAKLGKNKFKFVYNFTNPKSNNNEALELISKHSFRMNWSRNIFNEKLYLSYNLKYSGEKFIFLGSQKLVLDAYSLSDIILSYDFSKTSSVKIGYKNIFNYTDDRRFLEEDYEFLTTYDPGRRFILEFRFNYK